MLLGFLVTAQALIAALAVALTRAVWPRRAAAAGGDWLVVMAAAVTGWSLGAVAEALLVDQAAKTAVAQLEWVGTVLCPLAYLMLVGAYTGTSWLQRPLSRAVTYGAAAVALLVVLGNGDHGIVWDGYLGGSGSGRGFLEPAWGLAFPVIIAGAYLYAIVGVAVLTRAFLRSPAAYRGTFTAVVAAAALPVLVSVVFFTPAAGAGTVLVTAAFLVTASSMAWCLHRFPVLVQRDGFLRAARETIVEVMDEGVLVVDSGGIVVDANPAATRLLGRPGPLVGRRVEDVLAGWPAGVADPGGDPGVRVASLVEERRSGLVLDVVVSPLPGRDLQQDRVIVMRDATARAAAEAQLAYQATHDALTGLPNRLALRRALGGAVAAGEVSLLLLDLDGFKDVNDTYGHGCGDELLVAVAARLRRDLPEGATAARLGGDEFAVVLPGASARTAARLAQGLAARLAEPVRAGAPTVRVTASVGVACAPEHGGTPQDLERCADVAMYAAKGARGSVVVYDTAADPNTPERLALIAELPGAIAAGELVIDLQPLIRARDGAALGAEALVRWHNPRYGRLLPGAFLPLVEPAGVGRELTRAVMRAAIESMRSWPTPPGSRQVGINVSALDLADAAPVDELLALLAASGLPPCDVVLELTEDALLEEPQAQAELMRARAAGLRVALDDFGTGYASLLLLRDVQGATVKIDRTFIGRLAESATDRAIVRAVVGLAHELGFLVVAEGVENGRSEQLAVELGCDALQGFHIARPMPHDDLVAWLGAARRPVGRLAG